MGGASAETVPRSLHDLMKRVIHTVKNSGTRLAVYLRGWDTFREFSAGSVSEPPACKPCIIAANTREAKEASPPRLGLFPCLPLPSAADSLEDRYINFILGVSSYVAVGGQPVPLAAFRRPTSKEHVALIEHIRRQLGAFEEACGGLDPEETLGSGRSGRLLSDALERAGATGSLSRLEGSSGINTGARVSDLQPCAIMPLVASRLAFPESAADWKISEFLHGEMKEAYEDPRSLRVPDEPKLPKGKVCGSIKEFTSFARRADEANGVEIFGDDELERDVDGEVIVAGFFALWKSAAKDRTITSRLAQNRRERPLGASALLLAHGVLLAEIMLRPDEKLRLSGSDLPDAYHHALVSTKRAKTYAVGKRVSTQDFAHGPAYERMIARRKAAGLVPVIPNCARVAWRSLAMGDLNAVCFMTTAHLNLLRRHGAARDLARYRAPVPRGPVIEGVIVDDYDIACVVPRALRADEAAEDTEALARALSAYASVGLKPEAKKTFVAQEKADFWGATTQGEIGRVRAHREVTVRTMTLVVALLQQKSVTARVWLAILGLVVYVSLYARPALSFLEAVFHEADAYEPGVVFIPSKRARAELATWLSFVPFMSVDLRAEVDTRVFATDASSRSCAAVVSQLPEALVREIWRQRPRRGVLQRYAGEDQSDACLPSNFNGKEGAVSADNGADEEAPDAMRAGVWAAELCEAVGWEPLFHYSVRRHEHIVTKEARPICTLVRRLAAETRPGGSKVLAFVDSSPNIGAWAKGRSSSVRLAPHLRHVAPDLLLTDLQLGVPYVPTHANPADAPTRGRSVRRVPLRADRSALVDKLLAGRFDATTDSAFSASTRAGDLPAELLEPVAGPPYSFAFQRVGLRRGDENSLIGDGPPKSTTRRRARSLTREKRAASGADLSQPNVGELSLKLRAEARASLDEFLRSSATALTFQGLLRFDDPDDVAKKLVAYGQFLYDEGRSVAELRHAIIIVSREKRSWRPALDRAWEAVRKWEVLEPSVPHTPCPVLVFRAMIAVAAFWRWDGVVCGLIFMFVGSMRPGEALSVLSSAVVLPTRWRRLIVVALWRHKSITRGRAKGAHHVVFDEELIIDVLEAHVQRLNEDDLVVGLKPHAFRRKFDAIIAELGLESLGLTPASLRAGGATERHLQRESIADISWLLRHADVGTTRHYIQSAAAMLAMARVPAVAAAAVESYARRSRRALRLLCSSPPPTVVVVKRTRARSAPAVR